MKQTTAFADAASGLALRLLASLNLLFLLAFLASLVFATGQARADDIVCAGANMLEQMERDDPDLLATIEADAAKVENGDALLWRIEAEGVEPSHLFGTMHMSDPRILDMGAAARAAFDSARTVVIESTEILDEKAMLALMGQRPELIMLTDGTTITSLLSQEDREALEKGLAARGVPIASVAMMQPWMLTALVVMPACEMQRKAAGENFLDGVLAEDALAAGKTLAGLETMLSQLEAMASLPQSDYLDALLEMIALGDAVEDVMETMVVIYSSGRPGMIWPFFRAALPSRGDPDSSYAAFDEALISTRNEGMAENSAPFIGEGAAFIAVGALHLPGPQGLVSLLRRDGYTVTAVR